MRDARDIGLLAIVACAPLLASCQLPGDSPSVLAQQPVIDSGPSNQKLGPDGYPLVGAFPKSAGAQLDDQTVAAERASLAAAAAAQQNAGASSSAAQYDRAIADLKDTRKRQLADAEAALAAGDDAEAAPGQ